MRSAAQATQRVRKNAAYFRVNYLILMLCVTFITLLLNPTSLIVLGFLTAGWSYLFVVRTAPIVIGGRTFRCGLVASFTCYYAFNTPVCTS